MYPHNTRAPVDISHPEPWGWCDRCYFSYPLKKLRWQFQWLGNNLQNIRIRVCPKCYDVPSEFLRPIIVGPDPIPPPDPRPYLYGFENAGGTTTNLTNNSGVLALTDATGWPTSASGLEPGDVWSNADVITVVAGYVQSQPLDSLFYTNIIASQILRYGGGNLPTSDPHVVNQIWVNSGVMSVSAG